MMLNSHQASVVMEAVDRVPAVLLDVNLPALKVARSLGRRGIPVIGVVARRGAWAQSSRYLDVRVEPAAGDRDAAFLDYLIALSAELGSWPVLIPLNDEHVLFVSRHRAQLSPHYRFLMAEPDVMEAVVSKSGVAELAQRCQVRQPAVFPLSSLADVDAVADRVDFPALVKPRYSMSWQSRDASRVVSGRKVVVVGDAAELREVFRRLAPLDSRLILQELIPGPDENFHYYVGFFDADSDPLASFVGVKRRVTPIHFGSASYVTSVIEPDLVDASVAFMKRIRYRGHVGIEYKLDPRDGNYKLIEINARFGLWDGMASLAGIDFAYLGYARLTGSPYQPSPTYPDGIKWISFERDWSAWRHIRREGGLGVWSWARSITTGSRDYAVFALDDLGPFWGSTQAFLGRRLQYLTRRRDRSARRHDGGSAAGKSPI